MADEEIKKQSEPQPKVGAELPYHEMGSSATPMIEFKRVGDVLVYPQTPLESANERK